MSKLETNTIDTVSGSNTLTLGSTNTSTISVGSPISNGLTLSDNILFDTADKGIYLGTTTATASNLLDDYEEGTWSPAYTNNTNNLVVTHSVQDGYYKKIGNIVFITGEIRTSSVTPSANWIKLDNLPFTMDTSTGSSGGGITINLATDFGANYPIMGYGTNSSGINGFILQYRDASDGATAFINPSDLSTTLTNKIFFSGFYHAN